MKPVVLALSTLIGAAAIPAGAQTVNASDPDSIVAALQRLGYAARLERTNSGAPVIRSGARGVNFSVFFYGCTDNSNCRDINFSAGFTTLEPRTLKLMNDWNGARIIGKANIDDEGNPYIRHFVAGVIDLPPAAFDRTVTRWDTTLGDFLTHIDWAGSAR